MRLPALPNWADIIAQAALLLREAGVEDAIIDARILCAAILGIDRVMLLTHDQRVPTTDEMARFEAALARRAKGEPVARILGHREFWSLPIALNAATLVPRPDSETLIDVALTLFPDRRAPLRFLDLGTGSGSLLLALLSEFPNATGIGADIAPDAVKMATHNATQLGFAERGKFIVADWNEPNFTNHPSFPRKRESRSVESAANGEKRDSRLRGNDDTLNCFDLVISNPPYIAHDVIATLHRDVRDHDPMAALDGGTDGLDAYRALAKILPSLKHSDGYGVFEIGYDQADTVADIFRNTGFDSLQLKRDLAGQPRCLLIGHR
jgi:release factor glutamine methyltransferase